MIKILEKTQLTEVAPLFTSTEETMVTSCLEGAFGQAFADHAEHPSCAKLTVVDFSFLSGNASSPDAEELIRVMPKDFAKPFHLLVPLQEEWNAKIEQVFAGKFERMVRYALKKEPDCFDWEKLEKLSKTLPEEYSLRQFDSGIYRQAMAQEWSRDFCSGFACEEDFLRRGIGVGVLLHGELIAGAASYTSYSGGIEIEVDTREDQRRQGLAAACCAKLILLCRERELYPSWDAVSLTSVHLAEKLGYHFSHEYTTYTVTF